MSLRYYLLTILMFLSSGLAYAQSMDTMLVRVPQSELPLLERNPRLDMLDLYNSQMEAKGENIFGGYSYLLKRRITICTSASRTLANGKRCA